MIVSSRSTEMDAADGTPCAHSVIGSRVGAASHLNLAPMATGKRARSAAQPREPRRPPRLANAGNACPAHVPCTYWRARRRLARRPARFRQKMDPMSPHAAAPTTGRACERAGPAHAHRPARLLHEAAQWPRDGASNLASFPLQCPRPGPPVRLVRRPCCTMNPPGRQSNLAAGNSHLSGTLRMHVGRLICRASRAGTGGDMAIDPAAESAHTTSSDSK